MYLDDQKFKVCKTRTDIHAPVKLGKSNENRIQCMNDDLRKKMETRNAMRAKLERHGGNNNQWKKW